MTRELKMGIHNRFDFEVVDVKTGEVKQRAKAFNVICEGYYNSLQASTYSSIIYGSGSGTPSVSDTALFHYEGTASDAASYGAYDIINKDRESEGIWYRQIKRTIPNTVSINVNITEVGFGTSSVLLTHARLQDMNGNPISIMHTDTDIINVYCTLYLHYDGQNSDITIYHEFNAYSSYGSSAVNQSIVNRALLGGTWVRKNGTIGQVMSYIGEFLETLNVGRQIGEIGAGESTSGASGHSYDASTHTMTIVYPQISVSSGNIYGARQLGIGSKRHEGAGGVQHANILIRVGGTTIPTAHITGESVGVGDGTTTRFKTKFNSPYNAVVKVNGVAQNSGVTVNKYPVYVGSNSADGKWQLTPTSHLYQEHFRWVFTDRPNVPASPDAYEKYNSGEVATNLPFSDWGAMLEDLCPDLGVARINQSNPQGSNDGENWTDIAANTDLATPVHYKYYRSSGIGGNNGNAGGSMYRPAYDGNNIIFSTPPANGDVITIDYDTDTIPKDSDHVLDVTLIITFGEWSGE